MAQRVYRSRDMLGGTIRILVSCWRRWLTWRAGARTHRELRASCDGREQRLEDANVPALLVELHTIVYAAFGGSAGAYRADVEELLERYADLLIARQQCLTLLRRATPADLAARRDLALAQRRRLAAEVIARRLVLARACELAVRRLDRDVADLHQLIPQTCERAVLLGQRTFASVTV